MIINDDFKFIFIHIPKNSGTTISNILKTMYKKSNMLMGVDGRTGIDKMHLHTDVIANYINDEKLKKYFKFCIIRNHYEKVCSAWNSLKNRYKYTNINDFIKYHLTNEFIFGRELVPCDARVHYRPQYTFIYDKGMNKCVNFIVRYEYLNEDISELNKKHNIFIPPYGQNYNKPKYIHLLNKESIDKINKLYAKDFELFNYEKK